MRSSKMIKAVAALTAALAAGISLAQQTAPKGPSSAPQMGGMNMGSPTGSMMCDPATCPMMAQHQEIAKLTDQLVTDSAALQKQTNAAALRKGVAEQAALLKQLQAKMADMQAACAAMMKNPGGAMGNMPGMGSGMMTHPMGQPMGAAPCAGANCPMTGGQSTAAPKK